MLKHFPKVSVILLLKWQFCLLQNNTADSFWNVSWNFYCHHLVHFFIYIWAMYYHGVIILNRSNYCVSIFEYILRLASLWSHPRLGNLNETQNASSPGFCLKIFNSVFESINMGLYHKLFLQLFVIGFSLFCSETGKR